MGYSKMEISFWNIRPLVTIREINLTYKVVSAQELWW